jgi:hypothetical protein
MPAQPRLTGVVPRQSKLAPEEDAMRIQASKDLDALRAKVTHRDTAGKQLEKDEAAPEDVSAAVLLQVQTRLAAAKGEGEGDAKDGGDAKDALPTSSAASALDDEVDGKLASWSIFTLRRELDLRHPPSIGYPVTSIHRTRRRRGEGAARFRHSNFEPQHVSCGIPRDVRLQQPYPTAPYSSSQ